MLDKKSYDLLSYLLTLTEPETVTTISKVLNQSRRRIYYHLDKTLIYFLTNFSKLLICRYSLSLQAFPAFCVSGDTHIFS